MNVEFLAKGKDGYVQKASFSAVNGLFDHVCAFLHITMYNVINDQVFTVTFRNGTSS